MTCLFVCIHVAGKVSSLKILEKETIRLQRMAFADSTYRTRRSQWNKYYKFCSLFGYTPLPASESQMCNYITYLTKTLCYVSLINYISAVWLLHKLFGHKSCQGSFLISQTLKGAKRVLGNPTKQAPLLSPVDLKNIYGRIDLTDTYFLCFWCAVLTCFRALLRKAHVTKSDMCLLKSSFIFHRWGVMLEIYRTKTIQFRERVLTIPVLSHHNSIFDLKYHLELLFRLVGVTDDEPAFTYLSLGKKKVLTYSVFF